MDVMLKRFTVEGYRCFRNRVTLDLAHPRDYGWLDGTGGDVSPTRRGIIGNALVLGATATGKTNLGYALMDLTGNFYRATPADSSDDGVASRLNGDERRGTRSSPISSKRTTTRSRTHTERTHAGS